jgi:hypothetical protein
MVLRQLSYLHIYIYINEFDKYPCKDMYIHIFHEEVLYTAIKLQDSKLYEYV